MTRTSTNAHRMVNKFRRAIIAREPTIYSTTSPVVATASVSAPQIARRQNKNRSGSWPLSKWRMRRKPLAP